MLDMATADAGPVCVGAASYTFFVWKSITVLVFAIALLRNDDYQKETRKLILRLVRSMNSSQPKRCAV